MTGGLDEAALDQIEQRSADGSASWDDPIGDARRLLAEVRRLRARLGDQDGGIFAEIAAERARAHAKHGDTSMESWPVDDPTGARRDIITEEVGEVAREFNDARHDGRQVDLVKVRAELIQVSSVTAAWADAIGKRS